MKISNIIITLLLTILVIVSVNNILLQRVKNNCGFTDAEVGMTDLEEDDNDYPNELN